LRGREAKDGRMASIRRCSSQVKLRSGERGEGERWRDELPPPPPPPKSLQLDCGRGIDSALAGRGGAFFGGFADVKGGV
jgi:hypothetical protein